MSQLILSVLTLWNCEAREASKKYKMKKKLAHSWTWNQYLQLTSFAFYPIVSWIRLDGIYFQANFTDVVWKFKAQINTFYFH